MLLTDTNSSPAEAHDLNEIAVFPIRLAIVEDEPAVAEALNDVLVAQSYEVEVFHCPMKALKQLTLERFDGLLLDYRMPTLNGRQFFEKARRRGIVIPTVLISGFVDETRLMEMVNLGLCRFLQKPASSQSLFGTLRSLGLGPDRALSRRAEWEEWREHWKALTQADEAALRATCLTGIPWNSFRALPARSALDRNLICEVLRRWDSSGVIALEGDPGADFEPILRELLPIAHPYVRSIEFMDGTGMEFATRLEKASSEPVLETLTVGLFSDASAVAQVFDAERAGTASVGWVLEAGMPGSSQRAILQRMGWMAPRVPSLGDRPQALAHYARVCLCEASKKAYGREWQWSPEAAAWLMIYNWPGNLGELEAVVDAIILRGMDEVVSLDDLKNALQRVSRLPPDLDLGPDRLRDRLRADILRPLLKTISDDELVATLARILPEQATEARHYCLVLDGVEAKPHNFSDTIRGKRISLRD